jgi:acyl carrier protein
MTAPVMTDSDVVTTIREGLCAVLPARAHEFDDLTVRTVLADLGVDSLKMMELIARIEDELVMTFHEDDLARARTIGDLAELMRRGPRR